MSWNNALPWWFMEVEHEHYLAECTCCFYDELAAGTTRSTPKHVTILFKQWETESAEKPEKYFRNLLWKGLKL